jgi:hypothetical protein
LTHKPDINAYGVDRTALKNLSGTGRKHKTLSIFFETNPKEADEPAPYYLGETDVPGKVSVRKIYMDKADLTEHDFAMELLGSWAHWEELKDATWFIPYLEKYRAELSSKLRSDAIKRYAQAAKNGEPGALKWFADKGWEKGEEKRGKGRPSKAERQQEVNKLAQQDRAAQEAWERMHGKD